MKSGKLIIQNLWVVEAVGKEVERELKQKYKINRIPEHIIEEMRSAGIVALCSSLSKYKSGKGTKPSTFAWRYVKTYMRRVGDKEIKHFLGFISDNEVAEIYQAEKEQLDELKDKVKVTAGEYGEDPLVLIEAFEETLKEERGKHLPQVRRFIRRKRERRPKGQ